MENMAALKVATRMVPGAEDIALLLRCGVARAPGPADDDSRPLGPGGRRDLAAVSVGR